MFLFNRHLVEELCQGQFDDDDEDDGSNLFYNWAYPFLWIELFLSLSRYIVNYDAPLYMTSFLGTRDQIQWWLVLLGALQDFMTGTHLVAGTLILGYVTVTHAVTINFWLREAHRDNENVATKEHLRSQERAVQLFRAAQVLSGHFNLDVARCSVTLCAFINWSAAIVCGFTFVRSLNYLMISEFPGSILYPVGVIVTSCSAMSQLSQAAAIRDVSMSFLDSWCNGANKEFRRFLASCQSVKVDAMGVVVSRRSLVTFFKTVTDHIIDCIITFR
ncbi:uncharacterized protein LOC118433888 [Folsomia candida]|nr:uncharacterized protein LOC118433888 [Folsomia candida]